MPNYISNITITWNLTYNWPLNSQLSGVTWDNKTFAPRTNSEFVSRPVLHIVLGDLWSTSRLANSDFVLATNMFLSHVYKHADATLPCCWAEFPFLASKCGSSIKMMMWLWCVTHIAWQHVTAIWVTIYIRRGAVRSLSGPITMHTGQLRI